MSTAVPLARIIVVGNLKGGTGKSTVTVNLAAAVATIGRRVAIVDTDPQATAFEWVGRGKLRLTCIHRPLEQLDEAGDWLQAVRELQRVHDLVIVDLPGVAVPALALAYLMADLILIPSAATGIDMSGTRRALRHVTAARHERPRSPPRVMMVPTRVVDDDAAWPAAEQRLVELGEPIAPRLRLRADHDAAYCQGDWVGSVALGSAAHRDIQLLADAVLLILGDEVETPEPTASLVTTLPDAAPTEGGDAASSRFAEPATDVEARGGAVVLHDPARCTVSATGTGDPSILLAVSPVAEEVERQRFSDEAVLPHELACAALGFITPKRGRLRRWLFGSGIDAQVESRA